MKKLTIPSKPKSQPIDPAQPPNDNGGHGLTIDKWTRLDRFLTLGSELPVYYQNPRPLNWADARSVRECLDENVVRTVKRIVDISRSGRAPKNDPAIFALILGVIHPNEVVRRLSATGVPMVCRTAAELFQFITGARAMRRGWGTIMKRCVAKWYDRMDVDKLAYQAIKYRMRQGFDHKRALRCAHPIGNDNQEPERTALYRWIVGKDYDEDKLPDLIKAHLDVMALDSASTLNWPDLFELVRENDLPWEALPAWALSEPGVWQSMLPNMDVRELITNLGAMTANGALVKAGGYIDHVIGQLTDETVIAHSKVHPFQVLNSLASYRSGIGYRGKGTWEPVPQIIDALDEAFYLAFRNVEPTGKKILIALDTSTSMDMPIKGSQLTARQGATAMALITRATETKAQVLAFTAEEGGYTTPTLTPLTISPNQRLNDLVTYFAGFDFGATDCAVPMRWAQDRGRAIDAFVIFTDHETWTGEISPAQALDNYRRAMEIDAKLVVVGMTSTGFQIADPNDPGMLDIVGFDAACPALIADFIRGDE